MTGQDIHDRLQTIFRDVFDDETIEIGDDTTAADIEQWDSFHHINIIMACEVEFGIAFKAAELEELHRVGDLIRTIAAKTAGR